MRSFLRPARGPAGLAAFIAAALFATGCQPQSATVTVDPAQRFQTFNGWEATAWLPDDAIKPAFRDRMVAIAADEVGINRLRLEVRSGAENTNRAWEKMSTRQVTEQAWRPMRYPTVNDNDDPQKINWAGFDFSELDFHIEQSVIPMRQKLAARGERLIINLCYVAFTKQIEGNDKYGHTDPEEYAELVLATYLHMQQKYGFVPDMWEVLLEPDLSGLWSGKMMGEAIVASARRLKAAGFTPRFVAPSVENLENGAPFLDGIASVPGAMENVVEVSYHRYNGVSPESLEALVSRAQKAGKRTAMLEWWFTNATPQVLHEDLTKGGNGAWQGQTLGDLFIVLGQGSDNPGLELGWDTRLNSQYYRYIRAGAQRLSAVSSHSRNFDPVAFADPKNGVAVVMNVDRPGEAWVKGLPAGEYKVSYSTREITVEQPGVQKIEAGGRVRAVMPKKGVIAVYDARLARPPLFNPPG